MSERKSWVCDRCGSSNAPHLDQCLCKSRDKQPAAEPVKVVDGHQLFEELRKRFAEIEKQKPAVRLPFPGSPWPRVYPLPGISMDCSCPLNHACMNVACPRAIKVTYSTIGGTNPISMNPIYGAEMRSDGSWNEV